MNRFGQIASSLRSRGCFGGVGSALAVVLFCVPALLFGQVRIQSGQALDANPMLGSGGFNSPVSGYNGLNSQLYITGQVSGLAAFRGTVNYFAPNQINLNLPSDELSRFRQQSVGVSDVLTGTPYATTPYFDRARTTALLPNITAGQTIPGTNVLRSPTMSTPLQPFPSQMAYQPLAPSVPSGAQPLPPINTVPGFIFVYTSPPEPSAAGGTGAVVSPFGTGDTRLARELKELRANTEANMQVDTSVDSSVKPQMPGRERELVAEPNLPGELQPGGLQPSARVGTALLINVPPVKAAPLTGQDVFTDLQARMEQQRIKESGEVDIQGRPLPRQMTAEAIKEEMRLRQGTPGQTNKERMVERGAPTPGAASPVEVTPDKRLLLHSLAGLMQDDFNTRMALGQQNLKAGRYEDAVTHFQIAVSINPDNPLAKVALALAMFSAGQPLNGATQLKRAMIAYPPLMETRLDLPAMMNTKDLKSHLSFLDARLNTPKTAKEPDIYFIAAYLYWNLNMKDQARNYALKLKSSPDITTTMTNFAAMVLKDVGPATAPASQPAPTAP